MNIFKEMHSAVAKVENYRHFLQNRKRKVFLYGIVIMLFYFALTILIPVAQFQVKTGGLVNLAKDYIPEFELSDGILRTEQPIYYEDYNTYVDIDTASDRLISDTEDYNDLMNGYSQVLVADQEKMILKDDGQISMYYFSDLGDVNFNRNDILGYIPMLNLFLGIGVVLLYFWEVALFFFGILFVALGGMIIASCMKLRIGFGQLYLLSVYSRTLPLLIKGILKLFGVPFPFFWILNFGISFVYLCFALQKIKNAQDSQRLQESAYDQNNDNNNSQF